MAPLFVLTPATLSWTPILAGYLTKLKWEVSIIRSRLGVSIGTGEQTDSAQRKDEFKQLSVATRCHANFVETVPLAVIFLTVAELNGAPTALMHFAYAALFAARVLHVEFGMKRKNSLGKGRPVGTMLTDALTVGAGLYNGYLGFDTLKTFFNIR